MRFVAIGAVAAAVDLGIYQLLLALGVWAPLAKGISFILGTTTAYLLNRRYTFAASKGGSGRFLGFVILYGSTFAANVAVATLVLWLLHAPSVGTPPHPGLHRLVRGAGGRDDDQLHRHADGHLQGLSRDPGSAVSVEWTPAAVAAALTVHSVGRPRRRRLEWPLTAAAAALTVHSASASGLPTAHRASRKAPPVRLEC